MVGLLRHQRRLVEAGKNELELAGIPVDIADSENTGRRSLESGGIDGDQLVVLELKTPIGDRTELHGQAEERQQRVASDFRQRAIVFLDDGLADLTVLAGERGYLPEDEIDFALADQRHHFVDAVGCGAEFAAPMQEREMARDRGKVERPVERAVAAADDENALAAERLDLAHRIEHRLAFVGLDPGNRRTLGLERAAAGGDDDDLALEYIALIGFHAEQRLADLFHRLHHFVQMILRVERFDLLQQSIDEAMRARIGNAGNVVDRFFRIELGALAADFVENVDEVTFHVEQAELKYREQADWPGADDKNIGLDRFTHIVSVVSLH